MSRGLGGGVWGGSVGAIARKHCRTAPPVLSQNMPTTPHPQTSGAHIPTWRANKEPPFFFASAAHVSGVHPEIETTGTWKQNWNGLDPWHFLTVDILSATVGTAATPPAMSVKQPT